MNCHIYHFCGRVFICASSRRRGIPIALGVLLAAISTSSADGSIVVPQPAEFAAGSEDAGANTSTSAANVPTCDNKADELQRKLMAAFATGGGTSSTSSTSTGDAGGTNVSVALEIKFIPLLADEAVAGRLLREARFSVPLPPVRFLIRPPQQEMLLGVS
jgi:hypothetical protein